MYNIAASIIILLVIIFKYGLPYESRLRKAFEVTSLISRQGFLRVDHRDMRASNKTVGKEGPNVHCPHLQYCNRKFGLGSQSHAEICTRLMH